jgi:PAS domain S-box-containing protein
LNILIVDDNPTNRKLLRVTLKSLGHEVVEAGDGVEALNLLASAPFHAMISDILMPNMDGFRLCLEVRQIPALKNLPIVLYSNTYTSPGDAELSLSCGASAYLEKPVSAERLEDVLRKVLARPIPAESGRPKEEFGVLKKYSERLITRIEEQNLELSRQKAALEASEEKFRQLAENIQQVFWIRNLEATEMLYVSPAYEQVWGRTRKELYANPAAWTESVHPEDRERIKAELSNWSVAAGPVEWEYRIVRPDGALRWIRARNYPVPDSSGNIYRIVGIAEDITERRGLEAQLLEAQKMEAVGRLAGGIAHDFNNLLTVINGYSHLTLEKLVKSDPIYKEIEEIHKAGEHAAALTRQLLAFSRKQVLQPQILNLNAIVSDIDQLLRRLIGENIVFVTRLDKDLGSVKVDPGQIERVIVNLAANARDAMPQGGKLTLTTSNVEFDQAYALQHREVAPGRYVMIAITDSGAGMTEDVKSHLFEPFFTTKGPGKGTGLGLATVHGVVRQSGGHIGVTSEPGRGTTFKIHLPRVEVASEPIQKADGPRKDLQGSETLLLVEDEASVLLFARSVLVKSGYRVIEARHAEEALLVAERHTGALHLLLTDLVMPGLNGLELARRLVALKPGLRVIYMSGYSDTLLHEGILPPGTAFLSKPFTPETLLGKVRETLEGGNQELPG